MSKSNINNLRNRMFRAGSWAMASYMASQILRLGGNLVLTRLLVPEMFGVMSLVAVILFGLNLFSDFGLRQNIVQSNRGEEPEFLNTAWIFQIGRGVILSCLVLVLAGMLFVAGIKGWLSEGTAYANPILPIVVAVMSIIPFINGFESTKIFVANRRLSLGRVSLLELFSQVMGLIVMVVWAMLEQTIWALVAGNIVTSVTKMLLSHIVIPGAVNRFVWNKDAFHEIFHFGKWIFASSILGFLLIQGDKLLLGGLVSAETMGIYSIAFFLASATRMVLERFIGVVFFPALSEVVRDHPTRLPEIYYKVRRHIDMITLFVAGFLFTTGSSIVEFLYDPRYMDAGWMLEVLSISLISVGFLVADQCFLALGHPRILSILTTVQMVTLYILLPLLFFTYGMSGAVWAIALSSMPRIIGSLLFMRKHEVLRIRNEFMMMPMCLVGGGLGSIVKVVVG